MKQSTLILAAVAAALSLSLPALSTAQMKEPEGIRKLIEQGKYLVLLGGCNDCHSPKVMTPLGPVVDQKRILAGTPAEVHAPALPDGVLGDGKWGALASADLTMWAGPWGVSFGRNLTPDKTTGLGSWTEAMFIRAMRTGKDMGVGRPILPPMPVEAIGKLTDHDLKAIFAYLKSLTPVRNAVPDPVPPAGAPGGAH